MSIQILVKVDSESAEVSKQQLLSLKKWIEQEEIKNLEVFQNQKELEKDDAGGGELLDYIILILGTPTTIYLAKSIHTWIKQRAQILEAKKKKLKIKIEKKDGSKFVIETENFKEKELQILDEIKVFLE